MSKLSQLKQDAYQAGKKRDWDRAVSLYEQILDLDKNNPTLINELGDLCLKAGATPRGVKHFLAAASKYRQSGLLNNAVAIYKKILRYDSENLNAHWYLAESRASQGLLVEGETHALIFLGNKESLSGDIKEIFLKRCVKLFDLYTESLPIMENLLQVFRMWTMALESGRVQIRMACLMWEDEEQNKLEEMVQEALGHSPELLNYPEHARWVELRGPSGQTPVSQDYGAVDLDGTPPGESFSPTTPTPAAPEPSESLMGEPLQKADDTFSPTPAEEPAANQSVDPFAVSATTDPAVDDTSFADVASAQDSPADTSFADLNSLTSDPEPEQARPNIEPVVPVMDEPDDSGCFNLDMDEGSSLDDLLAQAAADVEKVEVQSEDRDDSVSLDLDAEFGPLDTPVGEEVKPPAEEPDSTESLLDQILSDNSNTDWQKPEKELETISEEIGAQMGGGGDQDDPSSLYEMGMVYLEMGLHDQACESFQQASCHQDYAVRAHEMWGITLQRVGRFDEAIAVLTDGLDIPDEGSREYLGLLYHIARAHEQAERPDEAQRLYLMITESDPGFLDVRRRLSQLGSPI